MSTSNISQINRNNSWKLHLSWALRKVLVVYMELQKNEYFDFTLNMQFRPRILISLLMFQVWMACFDYH